jgi:hypothetical protein
MRDRAQQRSRPSVLAARPDHARRADASAHRESALVREPEAGDERSLATCGPTEYLGVDVCEVELGSTEHGERAICVDGAPGQLDEPVTGVALDERSTPVDAAVSPQACRQLELPHGGGGIPGNERERFTSAL